MDTSGKERILKDKCLQSSGLLGKCLKIAGRFSGGGIRGSSRTGAKYKRRAI